jgi:hypothetical protein
MANATRSTSSIILRLVQPNQILGDPNCRAFGYLNTANFVSLFETVDLAANPRLPRVNPQVQDMWKAIDQQPEYFQYKNNGILPLVGLAGLLEGVGHNPEQSAGLLKEVDGLKGTPSEGVEELRKLAEREAASRLAAR